VLLSISLPTLAFKPAGHKLLRRALKSVDARLDYRLNNVEAVRPRFFLLVFPWIFYRQAAKCGIKVQSAFFVMACPQRG
jgi:hypothetical protein